MRRITLFFLVSIALTLQVLGQDTVVVQTLTIDSTVRAGVWNFPSDTTTWRKIYMRYRMRCHDALVGNGSVGCREWDYHCNTVITDSSRRDSILRNSPNHVISNFAGTTFNITAQPTFTYTEFLQQITTYASPVTPTYFVVGSAPSAVATPFSGDRIARTQYLYLASELSSASMTAGLIHGIELDLSSLGGPQDFLRIRIRGVSQSSLSTTAPLLLDSGDEVYFLNTTFSATGSQQFRFHTPFSWNGADNLLVEICHDNAAPGAASNSSNASVASGLSMHSGTEDGYVHFSGAEALDLDASALSSINNEITVAFWAYGSANLPQNTTAFEATNTSGARHVNAHLPWSDGRAYWDCGADAGGYDRIDIAVNPADYKGRWTHWAFTKNAATGEMKIFKNGVLFHSGTGKTKPISIANFRVGKALTGSGMLYYGDINDFQIWSKALDAATIQSWMHRDINAGHPDYAFLKAWYKLDESTGTIAADASPIAASATLSGGTNWRRHRGSSLHRNFSDIGARPISSFYRGAFTLLNTTQSVLDSLQNGQHQAIRYNVQGTDLVAVDTNSYYQAGYSYVYSEAGLVVDSVYNGIDSSIVITQLTHFAKSPARYELLSFITPYGNGLDLGQDGVMWEFDVTDFAPILRGAKRMSVEGVGNYQEELDIQFLFISGTPPRPVLDIQQLWPIREEWNVWSGFGFNEILNNSVFEPRQVSLDSASASWKLRSAMTGHGQNGEFIQRWHYLNINGGTTPEFRWQGWKECSTVPVYPQGGTWLFDRAGWCPGDPTVLNEYEIGSLAAPGQTITIDYGMDFVSNTSASDYRVSNQLVSYGPNSFSLDAALERVKRPSLATEFARFNPACNEPVVIIKNEGTTPLTSLTITYNRRGGTTSTYQWTGNLGFLESEEVALPVANATFWAGTEAVFEAHVSNPNGGIDEQPDNDHYFSPYQAWDIYAPGQFELNWRTNTNLSQTSWKLLDETGAIVFQSLPFLTANTVYSERFDLAPGCYTLKFADTGDDGLYYWYTPSNGTGFARIKYNGVITKVFEAEFGRFFQYDFYTEGSVSREEAWTSQRLVTYPNPSEGNFNVHLEGVGPDDVSLEVFDLTGRRVWTDKIIAGGDGVIDLRVDLGAQPAGAYWLRVLAGGQVHTRELIKQ